MTRGKLKTNRSAIKRIKVTKSGKLKRHHAFARHLKSAKTPKRRRALRQPALVSAVDLKHIKLMMPYMAKFR
jgi:large subunit ribosomal protein L35